MGQTLRGPLLFLTIVRVLEAKCFPQKKALVSGKRPWGLVGKELNLYGGKGRKIPFNGGY